MIPKTRQGRYRVKVKDRGLVVADRTFARWNDAEEWTACIKALRSVAGSHKRSSAASSMNSTGHRLTHQVESPDFPGRFREVVNLRCPGHRAGGIVRWSGKATSLLLSLSDWRDLTPRLYFASIDP